MKLFAKQSTDAPGRRLGIVEELEMFASRARLLVFATPVLLLAGLGLGLGVRPILSVREGEAARTVSGQTLPRVHVAGLSRLMEDTRKKGTSTAEYVRMYQQEVSPVERVLVRRGVPAATARRVAWPLVEQSYRNGVDPATVISVVLIESAGKPDARSSVGARGLMQIMPAWAGYWRGCGSDLYAIEDNLCNGTKILAYYLDRSRGDERRALLGYNGCVNGTNTPDCGRYPDKIDIVRRQVRVELASASRRVVRQPAITVSDDE
jgi:soluble lytic murein transglycosylase-like protein